jgi:hypothetical protein
LFGKQIDDPTQYRDRPWRPGEGVFEAAAPAVMGKRLLEVGTEGAKFH